MTPTPYSSLFSSFDTLRIKRLLGVLVISILLHLVALHWAGTQILSPSLRNLNVIRASLHHSAASNSVVVAPGFSPDIQNPTTRRTPVFVSNKKRPADAAATLPDQASINLAKLSGQAKSGEHEKRAAAPTHTPSDHYSINLPPSTVLQYEVTLTKRGEPFHGKSTVSWQSDGKQYTIRGSVDITNANNRFFQSEGSIDESGIAPLLYSEKSNNKSVTNTHFQRERNIISFSSSTVSYPMRGGEQDRASIIWQLIGVGRGAAEKFKAGTDFDMFVAGVRDGEQWQIQVLGKEEIDRSSDKIDAWHLVRLPPPGSYQQRLDIWLAPREGWYPVQLRYTQVNGDTLELSLDKVSSVQAD